MQSEVENILDKHLELMATDVDAWAELLAEDVVVDFPYAPSLGRPGQLVGRDTLYNHIKAATAEMDNMTFSNVRKYPTADPDELWAELHLSAVAPSTGRSYEQDYVGRFKIKDGKIIYYSEYWNPMALTAAYDDMFTMD